jgi:hypothetical protein
LYSIIDAYRYRTFSSCLVRSTYPRTVHVNVIRLDRSTDLVILLPIVAATTTRGIIARKGYTTSCSCISQFYLFSYYTNQKYITYKNLLSPFCSVLFCSSIPFFYNKNFVAPSYASHPIRSLIVLFFFRPATVAVYV